MITATGAANTASILMSGPARMFNLALQGMTIVYLAECAFRAISTLSSLCFTGKLPEKSELQGQGWISKNLFDGRKLTRQLSHEELLKETAKSLITTILVTEAAYRFFGPPINGVKFVGQVIGVEPSINGIWNNLPRPDQLRTFFQRPV